MRVTRRQGVLYCLTKLSLPTHSVTRMPLPSPATPQLQPGERRADADPARIQVAEAKRALPVLAPAPAPAPNDVTLPKTATDAELRMIAGSILLALSLILLVFNRRQSFVR